MSPLVAAAVREAIRDWHREADGSRTMAEYHERQAAEARASIEAAIAEHEQRAAEHRTDEERALKAAAALEAELAAEGVEP